MTPPTGFAPKDAPATLGKVVAAEYVRMSTDHQRYSTANQSEAIHAYAARHDYQIARTYTDDGKSGLDIGGRRALQQLLADVTEGRADFRVILVYDVTRWGRFQNTDEAAHYEYLCTKAGIKVIYCAEPFDNDGSPTATIIKSVKRAMAAEYSRELSTKVFAGQCRLVRLGFHQGGTAGYGLRRALFDEQRTFKAELHFREHKSIQTDRVVLMAGPPDEVAVVNDIYRCFAEQGANERSIADDLNRRGLVTDLGRPWSRGTVHQLLTNEKYIGNNVYNRVSAKLKNPPIRNDPASWIRCEHAFEGIVSVALFEQVRAIITERSGRLDDAQMLAMLRDLLAKSGALSGLIIDEQNDMPSSTAYQTRFGGLIRAYALIGYTPDHDFRYLEVNRFLRDWHPAVIASVVAQLEASGALVVRHPRTDLFTVNGHWSASVVLARCRPTAANTLRWKVRFDTALKPDLTLVVRLDQSNERARDYYVLPRIDTGAWPRHFSEDNAAIIDGYRFDTLEVLKDLSACIPIQEVA